MLRICMTGDLYYKNGALYTLGIFKFASLWLAQTAVYGNFDLSLHLPTVLNKVESEVFK